MEQTKINKVKVDVLYELNKHISLVNEHNHSYQEALKYYQDKMIKTLDTLGYSTIEDYQNLHYHLMTDSRLAKEELIKVIKSMYYEMEVE